MRVHIPLILLVGGLSGCATTESVRYVYQDKSFGLSACLRTPIVGRPIITAGPKS